MIMWTPTARTAATTAVARLLGRPEWREGPAGDELRARLTSLLDDEDPVIRMLAIDGLRFAGPDHALDNAQLLTKVIDRLQYESDPRPRWRLLHLFARLLDADPAAADAYLAKHVAGGGTPLRDVDPAGKLPEDDDEQLELTVNAIVHLAVVHATPTAHDLVSLWCASPLEHLSCAKQIVQAVRDYLRPPLPAAVQERAFSLLSAMANLVADEYLRWTTAYEIAPATEIANKVREAAHLADDIAHQVYFASGAFDATQQEPQSAPLTADEMAAFAANARPLLCDLARVDQAQVVHLIVETLIHLVEVNPASVFHDVVTAVPSKTAYVTDRTAGADLAKFLQYMLANRPPSSSRTHSTKSMSRPEAARIRCSAFGVGHTAG